MLRALQDHMPRKSSYQKESKNHVVFFVDSGHLIGFSYRLPSKSYAVFHLPPNHQDRVTEEVHDVPSPTYQAPKQSEKPTIAPDVPKFPPPVSSLIPVQRPTTIFQRPTRPPLSFPSPVPTLSKATTTRPGIRFPSRLPKLRPPVPPPVIPPSEIPPVFPLIPQLPPADPTLVETSSSGSDVDLSDFNFQKLPDTETLEPPTVATNEPEKDLKIYEAVPLLVLQGLMLENTKQDQNVSDTRRLLADA